MRPIKYQTDAERTQARVLYNQRHYQKRKAQALQASCVRIGDHVTLYHGDARVIAPTLRGIHAVVSDPPYGRNFDFTKPRRSKHPLLPHRSAARWTRNIHGDDQPFDPAPWLGFPQVILWGANHYASRLPDRPVWLTWDKRGDMTPDDHSDCEHAWTNLRGRAARLFTLKWRGVIREGEANVSHRRKFHQAEKPIELMLWCVEKTQGVVLDPFMGSGSTLAACVRLGRPCIGIEVHAEVFDKACKRLQSEVEKHAQA